MVKRLAARCGFQLAGIAPAGALADIGRYRAWVDAGMAGDMAYLAGGRADVRADPRLLLPSARSVICLGRLYNGPEPRSTEFSAPERAWISRYAWGDDYHDGMRRDMARLVALLADAFGSFEHRIAVDTSPLLERSLARLAGLGWIGRNTCLINEPLGSWFFLGEILVSLDLPADSPAPDRCGTCTRCIQACPTRAIVPAPGGWAIDSRLCISYLTIELRGALAESARPHIGRHVFGCDICQDVCPWNSRAPVIGDFRARNFAPPLRRLASIEEAEFGEMFRGTPVTRARYAGFLRNVAVAMGNVGLPEFREPLERLAARADPVVAEHARWALRQLE